MDDGWSLLGCRVGATVTTGQLPGFEGGASESSDETFCPRCGSNRVQYGPMAGLYDWILEHLTSILGIGAGVIVLANLGAGVASLGLACVVSGSLSFAAVLFFSILFVVLKTLGKQKCGACGHEWSGWTAMQSPDVGDILSAARSVEWVSGLLRDCARVAGQDVLNPGVNILGFGGSEVVRGESRYQGITLDLRSGGWIGLIRYSAAPAPVRLNEWLIRIETAREDDEDMRAVEVPLSASSLTGGDAMRARVAFGVEWGRCGGATPPSTPTSPS